MTTATACAVALAMAFVAGMARAKTAVLAPEQPLLAMVSTLASGDTLVLLPGIHQGPITLSIPIALVGKPGARITGPDTGTVVTVLSDDCLITGLTITGSGQSLLHDDAGVKVFGNHARIVGNRIERNLHGMYLQGGDSALVAENVITGRTEKISADRGNGIHLWSATGCEIRGNVIRDTRDGIYVSFSSYNVFRGNLISRVRYGLHYMYARNNRFDHNTFEHCIAGAAVMFSLNMVVEENRFQHNRHYWGHGLLFADSEDSIIRGNLFVDNTDGLFLGNSNRNLFTGNVLSGNDVAVHFISAMSGNVFTENRFETNLTSLSLEGHSSIGETEWAKDGKGNFWSDYRGYDLDGDGIGDTPHLVTSVFEYLENEMPIIRLYLRSPAAAALEAADRALPVIDIPKAVDPSPLMRPPAAAVASEEALPRGAWLLTAFFGLVVLGSIAARMVVYRP